MPSFRFWSCWNPLDLMMDWDSLSNKNCFTNPPSNIYFIRVIDPQFLMEENKTLNLKVGTNWLIIGTKYLTSDRSVSVWYKMTKTANIRIGDGAKSPVCSSYSLYIVDISLTISHNMQNVCCYPPLNHHFTSYQLQHSSWFTNLRLNGRQ